MVHKDDEFPIKPFSIERNNRITAIAGTILFILIIAELVITANMDQLRSEHIFVGVLITGPLVVKLCSTGYRFFRYYTKSPDYVKAGPPNLLLRILAPFLVITTILVFMSGLGLVLGGHAHAGLFHRIHVLSVTFWLPLLSIHIYAYIRKATGLMAHDWTKQSKFHVPGRVGRLILNISALILSGIAAFTITPLRFGRHGHWGLPGPLALGLAASVIAILLAIPLLHLINKKTSL